MEIAGKTALVTGAGAGIGRAIALRLAIEGAAVVIADLDGDAGRETERQIADDGGRASFVSADVTKEADVEAIIAAAEEVFEGLDILVNNAGGYDQPVFPDAPLEHWSRTLDLNLRAVMLGIHFALEPMAGRGGGAIINVASTAGLGLAPHWGPEYAAAKAAVIRLTACLAPLAERGIRVNAICPYSVGTPAVRERIAATKAAGRELPPPLTGVLLEPEEVGSSVVDLIQDESLAGRVVVLVGGKPPKLLPAD